MRRQSWTQCTGIILAILFIAGFAFVAPDVQAQALQGDDLFGTAEDGSAFAEQAGLGEADLTQTIAQIIRVFLGFIGVILVVMILYGGFMWMTAGGNDDRVKKAKRVITNAVIGMVITLSSFAIAEFVISQISGATGAGDIAGDSDDGGGGYIDGGGGGSSNVFNLLAFNDECAPALQNLQLQWTFSQNVSSSTVNDGGIEVLLAGEPVEGTFAVSGTRVTFTPSAVCAGDPEENCFQADTTYEAEVHASILRSTSGRALECTTEFPCSESFTVGTGLDTTGPTMTMDAPEDGGEVIVGDIALLQSFADDDTGVSSVTFNVDGEDVYVAGLAQSTESGLSPANYFFTDTNVEWDSAGYVTNRSYDVSAEGFDCAGNADTSAEISVMVRAASCGNGVQDEDFGETGIDCGGSEVDSEFYCGACDGDVCAVNSDCASGVCEAGQCVSVPMIESVSPGDGAEGNLITISGSGFGEDQGSVTFIGQGDAEGEVVGIDVYSAAQCADNWTDDEIIVQLGGLTLGAEYAVEVSTLDGDADSTDDEYGPSIAPFVASEIVRPGVCAVTDPADGDNEVLAGSQADIAGNNFGDSRGSSTMYFDNYAASSYLSWSDAAVSVVVPNVNARTYRVQAFVGDNLCEIGGEQCASDEDCATEGDVCVFGREGSNKVKVDIASESEGEVPVIQSVESGWKACDGGLDDGNLCGVDADCAGAATCEAAPNWGPPGQYMTIYGDNFGSGIGAVRFVDATGGQYDGILGYGDDSFPDICSADFWSDTAITVKVPEEYTNEAALEFGTYNLSVQRSGGETSDPTSFVVIDNNPGPAICAIDPSAGPPTTEVSIFGENFGTDSNSVDFYDADTGASDAGADLVGSGTSWGNQSIAPVQVPPGSETGPVVVTIPSGYTSNSYNFTVGDCRDDASICGEGTQCCGDGSCSTSCEELDPTSYYAWSFSTGPLRTAPEVLVSCTESTISPSPWSGWSDAESVCLNAAVTATFSVPMNQSTLADNVLVHRCDGAVGDPCANVTEEDLVASAGMTTGEDVFVWYPQGGLFESSTTYQVTLLGAGILSAEGEPMEGDFAWEFTTSSSSAPCEVGDVHVSPNEFTATDAAEHIDYLAQPIAANDACVLLQCNSYTEFGEETLYDIDWTSSYSGAFLLGDGEGAFTSCEMIVEAQEETPPGNPAEIDVAILSEGTPSDTGLLTINFTDPEVTDYWPSCETACVNAGLGVRFNAWMDSATLTASNMQLRKCENALCEAYVGDSVSLENEDISCVETGGTENPVCDDASGAWKNIAISPAESLDVDSYYEMRLSAGQILSTSGVALSVAGANDGSDFRWIFRTKDDPTECSIDRITVNPPETRMTYIGQRQEYTATAWGAPDDCSVNGQILNADEFVWDAWSADDAFDLVPDADVAFMLGSPPGELPLVQELPVWCTNQCLNAGAPTTIDGAICGDNDVTGFEDCDDGNTVSGDGCSSICLSEGSEACESACALSGLACGSDGDCADTCEDAICADFADAGAVCTDAADCASGTCLEAEGVCAGADDVGASCGDDSDCFAGACNGVCSASGGACSGSDLDCAFEGDTCEISGFGCCGNGILEGFEECDDGDLTSGDGCSASCTNEGAVLVGATCNNGFVDHADTLGGEECEDGNRKSGDGCSSLCLNEGSISQSEVYATCGNGDIEDGEDCDDGNPVNGDGCSAVCLNEGTNICAKECTVSGNTCVNDAQCGDGETCDVINAPCCGNGGAPEAGEDCDDGNAVNGDGCSSACLHEGASAYGDPISFCGDAVESPFEECEALSAAGAVTGAYAVAESDPGAAEEIDDATGLASSIITASSTGITGEAQLDVSCSCQTDLACGEPSALGCGASGCCFERPEVGAVYPALSQTDVCLNTAVWVEFSELIDESSLDETVDANENGTIEPDEYEPNLYLFLSGYDETECATTQGEHLYVTYGEEPRNIFVRAWSWIKNSVRRLFGGEVLAEVSNACLMPVSYTLESAGTGTRVRLDLPSFLEPNEKYYVVVVTDPNDEDGTPEGVLSQQGVGISGNTQGIHAATVFYTGEEVCTLDLVEMEDLGKVESLTNELVDPSPQLFTQTGEEHAIAATAYSIRESGAREEIDEVTGSYEWDWSYGSSDEAIVTLEASGTPEYQGLSEAAGQEGTTSVFAGATITVDAWNEESTVGTVTNASLSMSAILCENPWPALSDWPFIDAYDVSANPSGTNFAFYYCRDAGEDGVEDDLPALEVVEAPTPGSGIFKEFLFIAEGTGDALGVRVLSNGEYLTPSAWYASQGFTGSATETQVDGYEAVRDGNTAYVAAANQIGEIYSNIYAISTTDDAGEEAVEIFEQVLTNFTFNAKEGVVSDNNVCFAATPGQYVTTEEGSFVRCSWDAECFETCVDNTCSVTGTACESNVDCAMHPSQGAYCDAEKAKLTRDLKRLTDARAITDAIETWGVFNGHCSATQSLSCSSDGQCPGPETCIPGVPELPSGSFIRNMSTSAWPSWSSVLGNALGTALPTDPLNQFVQTWSPNCEDPYDATTCYDGASGQFFCGLGSHVYGYQGFGNEQYAFYTMLEYDDAPWAHPIDQNIADGYELYAEYVDYGGPGPVEDGFLTVPAFCDGNTYGSSEACGDGVVGPSEVCEVGDTQVASCTVCLNNTTGATGISGCVVDADCASGESCVDGTTTVECFNDGGTCAFRSVAETTASCVPFQCGNGVVEAGEQCDDGALNGTYGYCDEDCSYAGAFACGDGFLAGGETCDCGSTLVTDPDSWAMANGCTAANGQYVASGTSCAFDCTEPGPSCGDGEVNGPEECDGGIEDWAGALCTGGTTPGEPCDTDSDCAGGGTCGGSPTTSACGSSQICLGGTNDAEVCTSDANCAGGGVCSDEFYDTSRVRLCGEYVACEYGSWSACQGGDQVCGNGEVEGTEECDDGNDSNTDSCLNTCEANVCGDDYVYSGVESCDDGPDNGQTCTAGYGGTCQYCTQSCQLMTSSGSFCGDGVINGNEFCDTDQVPKYCYDSATLDQGSTCTSNDDCDPGYSCQTLGVCNGGPYNGEACTGNGPGFTGTDQFVCKDTIGGEGECVFQSCDDGCQFACPFQFRSTSILAQTSEAGASQVEEVDLYSFGNPEDNSPENAVLYIPECTVGTRLTATIDKSNIVPPSVDLVFVTDRSGSMNWYPESSSSAPVGERRIDYTVEATNDAIEDLLDTYDAIGGDMRIGLVSFQGSSASIDEGFTSSESDLTSTVSGYLSPSPTGGTPMNTGLDTAVGMFASSTADIQVIVLLADGDPNNGCPTEHLHSNGVLYTSSKARRCTAYMNDVVWDNTNIQFFSAVINDDPTLQGYMAHISNNECTCSTTSSGCDWGSVNDCSLGTDGVQYAYQATNEEEISEMYEAIIDAILGAVVSFTSDVEGTPTVTSGSVRDGNNVVLPFPEGFECDGTSFTIPFNIAFNYSAEEADSSTINVSDFEFTYCPVQ